MRLGAAGADAAGLAMRRGWRMRRGDADGAQPRRDATGDADGAAEADCTGDADGAADGTGGDHGRGRGEGRFLGPDLDEAVAGLRRGGLEALACHDLLTCAGVTFSSSNRMVQTVPP